MGAQATTHTARIEQLDPVCKAITPAANRVNREPGLDEDLCRLGDGGTGDAKTRTQRRAGVKPPVRKLGQQPGAGIHAPGF